MGLPRLLVITVGTPSGSASGVPSPLMSTVAAVTVRGLPSGSVSLASTLPPTEVSSATGTISSIATGGLLAPMVSVSVAVSVSAPSLTV